MTKGQKNSYSSFNPKNMPGSDHQNFSFYYNGIITAYICFRKKRKKNPGKSENESYSELTFNIIAFG